VRESERARVCEREDAGPLCIPILIGALSTSVTFVARSEFCPLPAPERESERERIREREGQRERGSEREREGGGGWGEREREGERERRLLTPTRPPCEPGLIAAAKLTDLQS